MANNVVLPGAGASVATDDDGSGNQIQRVNVNDLSFLERICLKALSKLTFSMTGLRCDISGQNINTVTTVSAVSTASDVALGRASVDGQGIQLSSLAFQSGFRRNLVTS